MHTLTPTTALLPLLLLLRPALSLPQAPAPSPPLAQLIPFPRANTYATCPLIPGNDGFSFTGPFGQPLDDTSPPLQFPDAADLSVFLDAPVFFGAAKSPSAAQHPKRRVTLKSATTVPTPFPCRRIAQTTWSVHDDRHLRSTPLLLAPHIRYAFGFGVETATVQRVSIALLDGRDIWSRTFVGPGEGNAPGVKSGVVEFAFQDLQEVKITLDTEVPGESGAVSAFHLGP